MFLFKGTEKITINILEDSITAITFNSVSLDIPLDSISLVYPNDTSSAAIKPQDISFDTYLEMCTLTFPTPLKAGQAILSLDFSAQIGRGLMGFYLSSYKDASGVEQYIAATQFEPSSARRAFPCWDEPEAKAVFKLTLTVDEKYDVLSNTMEAKKESVDGGYEVDIFNFNVFLRYQSQEQYHAKIGMIE